MPVSLRLIFSSTIALALGLLLLLAPGSAGTSTAHAATTSAQASADHPYSDPTWFPLRAPAKIGCAVDSCHTSSDHHYWAIDFNADQGAPVYAAGAGVAHVGGNDGSCSGNGEVTGGRWVWIDHGAGVVSRYHHLDSITVKDGALVTPATQIGTVGHSGDVPPCEVNYLHFEVRHGGLKGERVDFGTLRACTPDGPIDLPQAFGFDSWNAPGLHPEKRVRTTQYDSSCLTNDWMKSDSAPKVTAGRADGRLEIALPDADAAQSWMVNLEIWRPSVNAWDGLGYRSVAAGSSSTTISDGIENDRRYRVRVAVHEGRAWSAWSSTKEALAVPGVPSVRYLEWRRKTNMTKSYLHYGWERPETFGSAITGYRVSRRCASSAARLGSWKTSSYSGSTAFKNIDKLKKTTVCEIKIQAKNAAGAGEWSQVQQVTR